MKPIHTILFATDFTENCEHAFQYALGFAKQFGSRLIIMHVINEPVDLRGFYVPHISFESLEKEIAEGADAMMQKFFRMQMGEFTDFESCLATGVPYEEILKKAREVSASLIVMGTQGRTGLDHLLFGSTAESVFRRATCPVMTVRLPETV